jgi:hypothetical protein
MKSINGMIVVAGVALAAAFGFTGQLRPTQKPDPEMATNGAYRDGLYQAKLDEQFGRRAHVRTGRWSSDADRASFLAGYQQGSDRVRAAGEEHEAFRQGLNEGTEARRGDRPFALRTNLRSQQSGRPVSREQKAQFELSYADGYQLGYYGEARTFDSEANAGQGLHF